MGSPPLTSTQIRADLIGLRDSGLLEDNPRGPWRRCEVRLMALLEQALTREMMDAKPAQHAEDS